MSELARRYAEALRGAGAEEAALRDVTDALLNAGQAWEALCSPAVAPGEKRAVLARLPGLGDDPVLLRFLGLLAEKGRMALLPGIVEAFHALSLERRNAAEGVLTCVRAPDAARLRRLEQRLCALHGRAEVLLSVRTDPALLGGFTLELDGVTYDRSVRGRLKQLSRLLEEGEVP